METVREFIRTLRENEELRDEVRRVILTEELLRLPAEFRALTVRVDGFIARQEKTNERQEATNERQEKTNERQEAFNQEIIRYHRTWEQRYNRDTERIRNATAYSSAARELALMAGDMGMKYVRTLPREEIHDMAVKLAQGKRLSGDLRSFAKADIIFAADRQGEECYIPVEVSYTADERDTGRAIRNAGYLTRLTGAPAFPAIACVNTDDKILNLIDSGEVHHHELEDTFLPES